MDSLYLRSERLLGEENIDKIKNATVTICGIGAVGGAVLEAICRIGVGKIRIFDFDKVSETNLNRQILTLRSNIGRYKTDVAKERILNINPNAIVEVYNTYIDQATIPLVLKEDSIILDCIDSVEEKIDLLESAYKNDSKIISSMGAALRLDPSLIKCGDLFSTKGDPLAKKIRTELKKRGIKKGIKVIYSTERVNFNYISTKLDDQAETVSVKNRKRMTLGSIVTVTNMFGLMLASECINTILSGYLTREEV